MSKLLLIGKLYPQNLTSYLLGVLVRLEIPVFSPVLNRLFVLVFGINMKEAELALKDYKTIEDVFTRKLKNGERSIDGDLVSPSDGTWSQGGFTTEESAIQAKGLIYNVRDLVFDRFPDRKGKTKPLRNDLPAPHNYHRVHSPVAGTRLYPLHSWKLWPVNEPFVRFLPRLFVRNERLVFDIKTENGGYVYAVMVGALNVGRIETPFLKDFYTNEYLKGRQSNIFELKDKISLKAGDELGTFMLGSTVVLVFDETAAKQYTYTDLAGKRSVRMGESLRP